MQWTYEIIAIERNHQRGTLLELQGSNGTVHAFASAEKSAKLKVGDMLSFDEQVDDGFSLELAS